MTGADRYGLSQGTEGSLTASPRHRGICSQADKPLSVFSVVYVKERQGVQRDGSFGQVV